MAKITTIGIPQGGSTGQVLTKTSGANYDVSWGAGGGGGGTPGGSNTQVQFNDSGAFGGDSGFTYNKTTNTATIENVVATTITNSTLSTASAGAKLYLFNSY